MAAHVDLHEAAFPVASRKTEMRFISRVVDEAWDTGAAP